MHVAIGMDVVLGVNDNVLQSLVLAFRIESSDITGSVSADRVSTARLRIPIQLHTKPTVTNFIADKWWVSATSCRGACDITILSCFSVF